MNRMLVSVTGLEKLSKNAEEILKHVEAIRELQSQMGPYDGLKVEISIDEEGREAQPSYDRD